MSIYVHCPACDEQAIPVDIHPAEPQTHDYPGWPAEASILDYCERCGYDVQDAEEIETCQNEAFKIAAEMDEPPEPDPYDEEHDR